MTSSAASSRPPSRCPETATEFLGTVARDHAVHLVVGVVERDGGTLYCTALMFGPDGTLLGTHRKLVPTAMERVIWGSGDGSTLPVVATRLGRIGSVICWENYMPLLRTAMYAKGVELYCALTVDDRDTWLPTVTHIALEGRCFVLSACQFLRRADLPAGYPTGRLPAGQDVVIRGGSCIIGPLGQLLAGPKYGEECIVTADLDRADLARAKFDFDAVGHYARPDVFRLEVDERPRNRCGSGERRCSNEGGPMIRTLLDACRFILEDQGEAQSPYWLASQADGDEVVEGERVGGPSCPRQGHRGARRVLAVREGRRG